MHHTHRILLVVAGLFLASLSLHAQAAQLTVSWTDNSTNETGFAIERALVGPSPVFTEVKRTAANVTSWVDTSLLNGTAYSYQVRAFATNTAGTVYSTYTNTATGTTLPALPVIPSSPTGATVTAPVVAVSGNLPLGKQVVLIGTNGTAAAKWHNVPQYGVPVGKAAVFTATTN